MSIPLGCVLMDIWDLTSRLVVLQEQLMGPPNATWKNIIENAAQQPDILKDNEVIKNVQNILQTNVSVCTSLGHPFLSQMSRIYTDMLNFYRQVQLYLVSFLLGKHSRAICHQAD